MAVERISGVLSLVVTKLGGRAKEKFWSAWLYVHWPNIVGGDIAAQTQPRNIERGVLFIAVASSVWQHHLSMMKPDLVAKLAQQTNGSVVDLRFVSGVWDKAGQETAPPLRAPVLEALTNAEEALIKQQVTSLHDPKVRYSLEKLLKKDLAWKKAHQKSGAAACQACGTICSRREKLCVVCARLAAEETRAKVKEILREVPWLSYESCRSYVKCDRIQFDRAKNELIDHCWRRLAGEEQDRKIALLLTMLEKNCPPETLTESMIVQTMEKARRKADVSSPGFRCYGSHSGSHSNSGYSQ